MQVLGLTMLEDFVRKHADAKLPVQAWLAEVKSVRWSSPKDVKQRFATVSFLSHNIAVFNIKGNNYRLAVQLHYQAQIVLVLRAGTHKEYDRWKF